MGVTLKQDEHGIWIVNFSGTVSKGDLNAAQEAALKSAKTGENIRVLILVDKDFGGFTGSVQDWSDVSFFMKYGYKIAKIAIVGDPDWESDLMMFAGAGVRPSPVKFFKPAQLSEANDWLR